MKRYTTRLAIAAIITTALMIALPWTTPHSSANTEDATPSNVRAVNGNSPGDVVISWDPLEGASQHRVGWLAVADYQANTANEQWRERFAYSDVSAPSSYTVTRLTPGSAYYVIVGRKQGGDIAWSQWATVTLSSGSRPCPAEPAVAPETTSALSVMNSSNPGEVIVSWDAAPGASGYRVGWLAVPDFLANQDNNQWRERFAYSDVNPASSFTITRLTPGTAYYFILGAKQGEEITWSQWASLALGSDLEACPGTEPTTGPTNVGAPTAPTQTFAPQPVNGDYDEDDDGLIEVRNLAQLDAIRLDRYWDSRVDIDDLTGYLAAFPQAQDDMGCQASECKGYELADHLDFDTNGNGEADSGDTYWNDGAGWEPITTPTRAATFGLEGNGYTISNLHIDRPRSDNVGLIDTNYRTIRNLTLSAVNVNGHGHTGTHRGAGGVGALVGINRGDIDRVTINGAVSGLYNVGSLAGINNRLISNSASSGQVSGLQHIGGLVGHMESPYNSIVSNCSADSQVSGRTEIGGLVGTNDGGSISNSTASGNVTGGFSAGGLVGRNQALSSHNIYGTITTSSATGAVSGAGHIGGLVGSNEGGIDDSTASGAVSGTTARVGGLVGHNSGAIKDSVANGPVSGEDDVGGLVGYNSRYQPQTQEKFGFISNSTARGTVSGNDQVGGLVGDNWLGNISGTLAEGDVTGRFYVGGLIGKNLGTSVEIHQHGDNVTYQIGVIEDSNASGDVVGVRWRDALVGLDEGGTITNSSGSGTVSSPQ